MGIRNRREFLQGAGVTITSATLGARAFAKNRLVDLNEIGQESRSAGVDLSSRASLLETAQAGSAKTGPLPEIRGLMVDAGRLPESIQYYRRIIEFCADWELNALQFRLADDQGSALHFASVPEIFTHKNAFTPEQLNNLAEYARSHGVDLIPELESFGHTGYITRSPAYAHLLDANDSSKFTGVIPVDPEVHQLFDKLYREVATIFPSIYFHGGCDEVNWGGSSLSRRALQTKSRAQIWAEYLNTLNQMAGRLGKQFIVWGDFVLHKEPEILGQLDKSIIIMDWDYQENSSARVRETFLKVRANGSRGIGAPGLIDYRWGARAGAEQLRNIDAFAEAYLGEKDPSSCGVILTNWVPSRYIQNSIWDGFAYAAVAFKEGTAAAQTSGFCRFVENHYRATWNEGWSQAFEMIYDMAPTAAQRGIPNLGPTLLVPWSNDKQLATVLNDRRPRTNSFTKLRSLLVQLEPLVLKNLSDFQAFALCVEYLERIFWRETVIIGQAEGAPLQRETADLLIKNIADRDQALLKTLSDDWDTGRFADSLAKSQLLIALRPIDQLLFQWRQATSYSASLASAPEHFYQLLEAAKIM